MFPIRDNIRSQRPPFVNWLLILANVAAFIWQLSWSAALPPAAVESLVCQFGLVPGLFTQPELADRIYSAQEGPGFARVYLLPFVSYMFLHGGFFHLLLNMVSLFVLGDNVEDRLGHLPYLLFYLAGGAAAGGMHLAVNSASAIPVIGASGAIAAVMGAYMLMFPRARVLTLVPIFCFIYFINIPAILFLGFWFFLQLMSGFGSLGEVQAQGVAWWAHIGGFGFGMLVAFFLGNRTRRGPPQYEPLRNRRSAILPVRSYRVRMD